MWEMVPQTLSFPLQYSYTSHDFLCPGCKIPATIPWIHQKYINTCTSDNILTILLMYCHQFNQLVRSFNSSQAEDSLKSDMKFMLTGDVVKGKSIILDYIQSIYPFKKIEEGRMYDCYGTEYGKFLLVFRHVWKLVNFM